MIREVAGSVANERVWESDRGRLAVRVLSPSVVLFVEQGYLEAGFAPLVRAANDEAVQCGVRPHLFVDAEALEGYDPALQASATGWLKENKARVAMQHMLVRSRLTRLGLSVASLALGVVVRGHSTRASFEAAMLQAMELPAMPLAR